MERALVGGGVICTIVGGFILWKDYQAESIASKPAFKYPKKLENNVYLVTGANTGKV